MSITISTYIPRSTQYKVPLTSQAPLGSGAFYKVTEPLDTGTVLDSAGSYKKFLADDKPDKYCIIYDHLYTGLDSRMALDIEIINGHGDVDNREAAAHAFNQISSKHNEQISKRSIPAADWDALIESNKLIKLA